MQEELIREQAFLRRLALRLVADESAADDLVQEANVAALTRPPERREALRGWLATVVRRLAGRGLRARDRRERRELEAARPETGSGGIEEVDRRLDAHAELLGYLRHLPDVQRQALFLRYAEELAPPAIAEELGVSLDTVKTRLRRGRERLRAELDARHGGREAWSAVFLAAVPRVAPLAPPAVALGKGVLMGTTMKLAGAVGVGAFVAWLALRAPEDSPAPRAAGPVAPERVARAGAPSSTTDVAGVIGTALAERRPAAAEPDARPEGWPSGVALHPSEPAQLPEHAPWPLVVLSVGARGEGATVRVRAHATQFGVSAGEPLVGVLDGDGRAELDVGPMLARIVADRSGSRPEELELHVEHPDLAPARARIGLPDPLDVATSPEEPLRVEIPLDAAAIIEGRLVVDDAEGAGLPESIVQAHALSGGAPLAKPDGHDHPAEDGRFRLRVDGEGPYALALLVEGRRPVTLRLDLRRGFVEQVGEVPVGRGLALSGRVLDAGGAPEAGAGVSAMLLGAEHLVELAVFSFELPMSFAWFEGAFELFARSVKSGEEARFLLDGLGPFSYRVSTNHDRRHAPFPLPDRPAVVPPAELELGPVGALVEVDFHFPEGEPRDGKATWRTGEESLRHAVHAWQFQPEPKLRYALPPFGTYTLRYAFAGCEPVELHLETPEPGGVLYRSVELLPSGDPARLTFVLQGIDVPDGLPFAVHVFRPGEPEADPILEASGGRLVLENLAPGSMKVRLSPGADYLAPWEHVIGVQLELRLEPGEDRVVPVRLERGGSLVLEVLNPNGDRVSAGCRIRDASGEELDVLLVARTPHGRIAGRNHVFAEGASRVVPELAPGVYRVTVSAPGYAPEQARLEIEAGRTREHVFELRLE